MADGDQMLIAIYIFIATCLFGIPCVKGIAQCSPAVYQMCCKRKKKPQKPKIEPARNPVGSSQFKATRVQVKPKIFEPTRAERPEDLNRNTFLQERKRRQAELAAERGERVTSRTMVPARGTVRHGKPLTRAEAREGHPLAVAGALGQRRKHTPVKALAWEQVGQEQKLSQRQPRAKL